MCSQNNCNNLAYTNDGYCIKHKCWSNETKYIVSNIDRYLEQFTYTFSELDKIKISIKLFNYLKYKIEFINEHQKFKTMVILKIEELNESCDKFILQKKYGKYPQKLIDKINELYISIN